MLRLPSLSLPFLGALRPEVVPYAQYRYEPHEEGHETYRLRAVERVCVDITYGEFDPETQNRYRKKVGESM